MKLTDENTIVYNPEHSFRGSDFLYYGVDGPDSRNKYGVVQVTDVKVTSIPDNWNDNSYEKVLSITLVKAIDGLFVQRNQFEIKEDKALFRISTKAGHQVLEFDTKEEMVKFSKEHANYTNSPTCVWFIASSRAWWEKQSLGDIGFLFKPSKPYQENEISSADKAEEPSESK